jgi:hypothetical protein
MRIRSLNRFSEEDLRREFDLARRGADRRRRWWMPLIELVAFGAFFAIFAFVAGEKRMAAFLLVGEASLCLATAMVVAYYRLAYKPRGAGDTPPGKTKTLPLLLLSALSAGSAWVFGLPEPEQVAAKARKWLHVIGIEGTPTGLAANLGFILCGVIIASLLVALVAPAERQRAEWEGQREAIYQRYAERRRADRLRRREDQMIKGD